MIRTRILDMIDQGRPGLEIGPLNRPIMSREAGPVEYIDRASREELRATYGTTLGVEAADIVGVDHIWGDQSLSDCVGGRRAYAYLIASHVIEHVPNLYGWLAEIAAVLEDGGLAAFIVPDKRYTFDILRRTSSEAEFVDAHVRGLRRPDPRQIFDCFYNKRDLDSDEIRSGAAPADVAPENPAGYLAELCRGSLERSEYIDAHCWVFTPRSFVRALDLGSELDAFPFEIAALERAGPSEAEFLAVLRRLPDGLAPAARRAAFVESRDRLSLPEEQSVPDHDVEAFVARARDALDRLSAIEASTSWRITAPLRAAVDWARSLGKP